MNEVEVGIYELSRNEQLSLMGGEILTVTFVLTYTAIAIITVVVWKLYQSKKGKATFPGGFSFEWSSTFFNPFLEILK